MIHRFLGSHEGPKSDLFLQYLSTGQFECARLMFQQVMREGDADSKSKLKRQAALVACGLRPAEWVPATSSPSSAHLAWLCRGLIEEGKEFPVLVDMFLLASSSLLLEAGIAFDDRNNLSPSDKIKMTINEYLANRERLRKLLQGPSNLACIVWSTLEQYMSESDAREILSLVTEALSQSNRDLDAVRLFAYSRQVTAPEFLARNVSSRDALALQALCILLAAQQQWANDEMSYLERVKSKHASICRFRGDSFNTVEASILQSFREDRSTGWLELLINDPFQFTDAPDVLCALNLLISTSVPSWSERLFQVQNCVSMVNNRNEFTVVDGQQQQQQQQVEQNRNEFAQRLHDRVNRLGFCSIVSETLSGAADVQAARLSHSLRGKTISDVLLFANPPFEVDKVRDLGSKIASGPGSTRNEQIQLHVVRCAVWLDALKQAENENDFDDSDDTEENSRLVTCTNLYLNGLTTSTDLFAAGYFWLRRGVFMMTSASCALKVTRHIRSTIQSRGIIIDGNNKLINSLLEAESRLEICEIAMGGDILEAMQSSSWTIYSKCMDNREYQLAMMFSKAIGRSEWVKQAQIGLELQDEERGSPNLDDPVANADYCIMRGIQGPVELKIDCDMEARVQLLMQKSRSFTPNVSEESFLASFPAKAYLDFAFDRESIFASQSSLRNFQNNSSNNNFRGGPIVTNFLQVLLELSTTLIMTPQQVFDLGLWKSICESALRDSNGRRISLELMDKVGLDLRRILLLCREEYSHTRSSEFWDSLEAIEKEIPIERVIGGPALFLMFGFPQDQVKEDVDEHYQMFKILTGRIDDHSQLPQKRRDHHAGSDFSLDSNDADNKGGTSPPTTTKPTGSVAQDQIAQVEDKVHKAVAHCKQQKENWLAKSIARRSCDTWWLLDSIKAKQMTLQLAFEKLTSSSKSTLDDDEALGEMAALLVGLRFKETQELILDESMDDIDGNKARILLEMITNESTKSMWTNRIVNALCQNIESQPHLQPLLSRTTSTIQQ